MHGYNGNMNYAQNKPAKINTSDNTNNKKPKLM